MSEQATTDGTMRSLFVLGMLSFAFVGCNRPERTTQTITASTDADGTLHPAELQLRAPARVTCLYAEGNNGSAANCSVNGASVAPPKESANATGKVYLLCEGAAAEMFSYASIRSFIHSASWNHLVEARLIGAETTNSMPVTRSDSAHRRLPTVASFVTTGSKAAVGFPLASFRPSGP
jgi:hypothetical protein